MNDLLLFVIVPISAGPARTESVLSAVIIWIVKSTFFAMTLSGTPMAKRAFLLTSRVVFTVGAIVGVALAVRDPSGFVSGSEPWNAWYPK